MWCDQAKSVWSRSNSVFIFLNNCMHHLYCYILQKTPLKLVNWFQRYEQLNDAKHNRKQKTFSALFGSILKSIFPTSDWFCLITSHIRLSQKRKHPLYIDIYLITFCLLHVGGSIMSRRTQFAKSWKVGKWQEGPILTPLSKQKWDVKSRIFSIFQLTALYTVCQAKNSNSIPLWFYGNSKFAIF